MRLGSTARMDGDRQDNLRPDARLGRPDSAVQQQRCTDKAQSHTRPIPLDPQRVSHDARPPFLDRTNQGDGCSSLRHAGSSSARS
jgi:hypothetical protein